jgi:eukaryotic-like serine/threonine-protein kinase
MPSPAERIVLVVGSEGLAAELAAALTNASVRFARAFSLKEIHEALRRGGVDVLAVPWDAAGIALVGKIEKALDAAVPPLVWMLAADAPPIAVPSSPTAQAVMYGTPVIAAVSMEWVEPIALSWVPERMAALLDASLLEGGEDHGARRICRAAAHAFSALGCIVALPRSREMPVTAEVRGDGVPDAEALGRLALAAARCNAPIFAAAPVGAGIVTYLGEAVTPADPGGGALCLVAEGARTASGGLRKVLQAVARRIGRELEWRARDTGSRRPPPAGATSSPPPREENDGEGPRRLVGLTLSGTYRLTREIGGGGSGSIFVAEDTVLGRAVAVKILHSASTPDDLVLDRLRREAAILGGLKHPSLVHVYTFGVEGEIAYLVMELIEGESAGDAIVRAIREEVPIDLAKVNDIVRQVAGALDAVHQAGVIHRDVKPANIMLDPFRHRVVLVDLGIAARRGRDALVGGTPGFMAPETLGTRAHRPTFDVFGLAVTAYALLTLRLPWPEHEDPMRMMLEQLTSPPEPISKQRPELATLDEVFAHGFCADPEARFETAGSFANAFDGAIRHLIASSAPASSLPAGSWPGSDTAPAAPIGQMTRGIAFRAAPRVLGVHGVAWVRAGVPELAAVLDSGTPPLDWQPTMQFIALLRAEKHDGRDAVTFARELGRATMRASFRRFFPASAATLRPSGTLALLPRIWQRYHSWGQLQVSLGDPGAATVFITRTPRAVELCAWVEGMLDQLVRMSGGGESSSATQSRCEARGDDGCAFEVRWSPDDYQDTESHS